MQLRIPNFPVAVRNNDGGFYKYKMFWKSMSSNGRAEPTGKLLNAIKESFGSFAEFKNLFKKAVATRFGFG